MESYFLHSPILNIPRSSLGYGTNNRHKEFPSLMSDGRSIVSNAQNVAILNQKLLTENGITNNWKYRQYMIKNANTIMEYNYRESSNDTGYIVPPVKKSLLTSELVLPYTFDSLHDNTKPYESSDLKELYLTRERLNSKKNEPVLYM